MNKTLTALLAGALICQVGCGPSLHEIRDVARVEVRTEQLRLEELVVKKLNHISRSVYCIKKKTNYESADGQAEEKVGAGTGFVFKYEDGDSYLITNAHVINSPELIAGFSISSGFTIYHKVSTDIAIADDILDENQADDIVLEVVHSDKDLDIAILKTPVRLNLSDDYKVDSSIAPEPGEEAYLIGFQLGLFKGISKGVVSNDRAGFPIDAGDYSKRKYFVMFALSGAGGSSGGPYFVRRGDDFYWVGTNCIGVSGTGFMGGIHISEYEHLFEFKFKF